MTTELLDYYQSLTWNIGVVPLRDDHFNRSKSYLKAMEQGARGIVTVCSNTGPYPQYIDHGVHGFLVNNPNEWYKHLRELVFNGRDDLRWHYGPKRRLLITPSRRM